MIDHSGRHHGAGGDLDCPGLSVRPELIELSRVGKVPTNLVHIPTNTDNCHLDLHPQRYSEPHLSLAGLQPDLQGVSDVSPV